MKYLIIGGGISGTTAAEELLRSMPEAEITIISDEVHPLYSRVLLPRYIKGTLARERCFLKTETWYAENNISFKKGTNAIQIDPTERIVTTSDGRAFGYDKLLIASSGRVLKFPQRMHGLSYFRTIDDADNIIALINECDSLPHSERRAGIIGGSFIAVEFINFFAERQIPTDLFMLEKTFFGGTLDEDSFHVLKNRIESFGVNIHSGAGITEILGNGVDGNNGEKAERLNGIRTESGIFNLSVLGIGIGIRPESQMFEEAGINVNFGIVTNEFLETNVPDIYAAGDVAEFYDIIAERHVMVGNWLNAQAQGRIAGKNMAGERSAFSAVRSYSTNICGIEVIFIGDTDLAATESIERLGSAAAGGVTQIFLREGRVVGATLVNRSSERAELTRLIREKAGLSALQNH